MQGLARAVLVQKLVNVGKIITERRALAGLANIVGVETRHLIGTGETHVANDKGRLTGKGVNHGRTLVALVNQCRALWNDLLHGVVRIFVNGLYVMRIVIRHFCVPLCDDKVRSTFQV